MSLTITLPDHFEPGLNLAEIAHAFRARYEALVREEFLCSIRSVFESFPTLTSMCLTYDGNDWSGLYITAFNVMVTGRPFPDTEVEQEIRLRVWEVTKNMISSEVLHYLDHHEEAFTREDVMHATRGHTRRFSR